MKIKFRIILVAFLIGFSLVSSLQLKANNIDKIQLDDSELVVTDFLNKRNLNSIENLSSQQELELYKLVHEVKVNQMNQEAKYSRDHIDLNRKVEARAGNFTWDPNADYYGDIFVTMDNKTLGFNHGHAGIGVHGSGTVVEANPGTGVSKFYNRINTYWKNLKTGGLMRVRGASNAKYELAQNYAVSMIGKNYGFNPFDVNDFYCSELVYYAWKHAGFDIASGRGAMILPIHIISDNDTYYVQTW